MAAYKVYVTDGRHADYEIERTLLAEIDAELKVCQCQTAEDIVRYCADADGLLLDLAPMNGAAVNGLMHCRIINRYGVGYDNVDVEACTKRGIQVTNVPDYCAEDVSDHALALLMSCLRNIAQRDRRIRQGEWNLQRTSFRLRGKTLGVLGFGRIAQSLAKKCSGFGLEKILAYDPYISEEVYASHGVEKADLDQVLRESDFISLHMPATQDTTGMINGAALKKMKPTAILINTSRGALIDDVALLQALQDKTILCAGLDVHCHEPLPGDSPYFTLDNVILTDHTAYNTVEAVQDLKRKSAENIVRALTGAAPVYNVNQL